MTETVLRLALAAAAATLGVLAARRSLRLATVIGGLVLSLILLKVVAGYLPAAEPRLFPWDFYPFVERWWYEVPALFLFGAGLWIGRGSVLKRDAVLVVAGLLLVRIVWQGTDDPPEDWPMRGRVDERGLCRQSMSFTCAPAAAAMFLDRHGVPATESEMAHLCVTRVGGTTDSGLARGLRRKLGERGRIVVAAPAYEGLAGPALVPIRLPGRIGHSLLLEERLEHEVVVADPLIGRRRMSRAEFESCWLGSAIRLEPPP